VVIRIRNGRIFSREKIYLNNINSNINDVMKSILIRFYLNSESIPKEISLQVKPTDEKNIIRFLKLKKKTKVNFIYPKIGEKSKELRISYQNAKLLLGEWIIKKNKYNNFVPNTLSRLKEDLRLKNLPKLIEAFDISHLSGSDTVASMVCFIDSKPKKNKYRKYNIKSVNGIDDFLSIYEVVYRRYDRLKQNNEVMPDLILIDGGKGQLKYALKALKELSLDDIPIVGLAKRLEEIFIPGSSEPQTISKQSPGLILLRRIRDEAHRFAITFQRSKRFKTKNKSIYLQINGFGEKRLKVLMENFEGYKVIADSTPEEIKIKTKIPLKLAEKVIEISRSLLKK
ncbi:MAG: excinuclease ABC subunit C, partial [Candidatus Marinimicrobia bacterium]|nr:excinuclease ABC subunit C [Candidatus Neomarinimicrobiota bacterium]